MGKILKPGNFVGQSIIGPNLDHPLNQGLVAWWLTLPGRSGGLQLEDIWGDHHGVLTDLDVGTAWVDSEQGKVPYLNGGNDYVDIPDPDTMDLSSEFTISAWVTPVTFSGSSKAAIIDKFWDGSKRFFYMFIESSSTTWEISVGETDGTSANQINVGTVVLNTLYHVVLSASVSGAWTFYVDAVNLGGDNNGGGGYAVNTSPLSIGRYYNNSSPKYFWDGQIGDIRIYNRALSAEEVQALYLDSLQLHPGTLWRIPRRLFIFAPPSGVTGKLTASAQGYADHSGSKKTTGTVTASAQGYAAFSGTKAVTGEATSTAQGDVEADGTKAATGVSSATAQGYADATGSTLTTATGKAAATGQGYASFSGTKAVSSQGTATGQGYADIAPRAARAGEATATAQGYTEASGTQTAAAGTVEAIGQGFASFSGTKNVRGQSVCIGQGFADKTGKANRLGRSVATAQGYADSRGPVTHQGLLEGTGQGYGEIGIKILTVEIDIEGKLIIGLEVEGNLVGTLAPTGTTFAIEILGELANR